ncbi:MAG: hypothetical protein V7750_10230 [Sneathiella sp.]
MKNVKEYLEKAYAAAMYKELYETAGLIEVAIESLCSTADKELNEGFCGPLETSSEVQKNVVVFPIEYSK